MILLAAFLVLQTAPPPDAATFVRKFDDLVRAHKLPDAAKYYEAHHDQFKDDPVFAKEAGRLEADYEDARSAPFRKTRLRIDFAAGAPGTRFSGPARLAPWPGGAQALDMTPQGPTPGTLLHLPAGTVFTTGAMVWIDIDVWLEGPEGTAFTLDVIAGKRGSGVVRSRLTVGGLKPGGWRRRTLSFASFALSAWPKEEKLMVRDGDPLVELGLIPPQNALGKLALRSLHVYEEDKHESAKLAADAVDPGGLTRLHRAALGGDLKKVKDLLAKGADSKARTKGNVEMTAVYLGAINGHAAVVEALLAATADPDPAALIAACRASSPKSVKAMLAAKADPNAKGAGGRTALHVACESDADRAKDQLDIVRQLLAAGANAKAPDDLGKTPVDVAELAGFKEAADLLRKAAR